MLLAHLFAHRLGGAGESNRHLVRDGQRGSGEVAHKRREATG
jgi:hypothetical protein